MSLINKMLNDLEKRDAFLHGNQDSVLDGLHSAYDVEITENRKSIFPVIISGMIIIALLIFIFLYSPILTSSTKSVVKVTEIKSPIIQLVKNSTNENINVQVNTIGKANVSGDNKILETEEKQLLKLDNNLIYKSSVNSHQIAPKNRIESIYFEENELGINLIMKMPLEIDYLIYGLTNPDRTVIEIENAELGFRLEELVPTDPIIAIRYSMNDQDRFKLVLESEKPLTIKKSTTSNSGTVNDLIVVMEYQWESGRLREKEEIALIDIVEEHIDEEKETVFKGELVKTPANHDSDTYAEKLFQQAYIAYKKGNISVALKKLNKSLDQYAGHSKARSTLALILSKQGHIELAYSVLNEGLIQYPENIEWIKMYAQLLLKEGNIVDASELIARHQPDFSSNTEYYALKAALTQKLSGHEEAAKIYRDLLQVNPLKSVWWMGLGISLESMKRYDDALYAYQKAFRNPSLAKDSRKFIKQRIYHINTLLEDESA